MRTIQTKSILLIGLTILGISLSIDAVACGKQDKPIVILHDNDVHCETGGFAKMAYLRDAMTAADTAYVGLVSSGDQLQGGVEGAFSRGQQLIDIMRKMDYDAITLGNHEFDYGVERMLELMSQLGNERVTCINFSDKAGHFYYPNYIMHRYGKTKVAYVGVLTPTTMHDEKGAFVNEAGEYMYQLQDYDEVVRLTQAQINKARKAGAKYVILLTHMGETDVPLTSVGLIQKTYGADAVLDGHTHSQIAQQMVKNAKGIEVPLTQTGTRFANVGKVYISRDGKVTTSLVPTSTIKERSARVQATVDSIDAVNGPVKNRKIGYAEVQLTILGEDGERLVRKGETNSANLAADAARWVCEAQLGMVNGGGVRKDYPLGGITYGNVIDSQPFGNDYNVIEVTGRQLIDVIAFGCSSLKEENAATNQKGENGDFVQPSGFRYTFSVPQDKVLSVEVLNEATGAYEPLELDRTYTLAVSQYSMSSYNDAIKNCNVLRRSVTIDNLATIKYIQEKLHGYVGQEYAKPQGRVTIIK